MTPAVRLLPLAVAIAMVIWAGGLRPTWGHDGPHKGRGAPAAPIDPHVAYPTRLIAAGGGHFHAILAGAEGDWLLAGTHLGLFRSLDRGLTWRLAAARFSGEDVHALVRDPATGVIRAVTHGQGLLASTDGGRTWTDDSAGLPTRDLHALAIDPNVPDHVYVWAVGHGLLRREGATSSWQRRAPSNALGDVRALAVHPRNSQRLYAATDHGIWLSSDGGRNWSQPPDGLRAPAAGIALVPGSGGTLIAATEEGVFFGDATASRWRPAHSSPRWWGPLTGFAVASTSADVIALSHEGVVARLSLDGGEWTPLAQAPPRRQARGRE
jgi:photosystem II stability/assembly factor-like uncharacterized protein